MKGNYYMPKKKSPLSLLIVEDERPIAHALKLKCESEGYATTLVADGLEALEVLATTSFDCILLDLIMPEKDGFAVLAEMKERDTKTPIIVLSNLGQESDIARCRELGAVHYFVKADMSIADVVASIKKFIE